MTDLSTVFTGIRFPNPFLLASAPPTESESNILRAYEAGWGGVVTKTIGLHPVVNVRGPRTTFLRQDHDGGRLSMVQASRRDGAGLLELGAHLRQAARMVGGRALGHQARLPRARPGGLRSWPARAATPRCATGRRSSSAVQDEGVDAVELNFSCPHMDRVDMGAERGPGQGPLLDHHAGGQGGGPGAGLGQADAGHGGHRRGGHGDLPGRRRCHRLLEHVPGAAAHRPRDPGLRGQRRGPRLLGRPRRPGHPPAVAGQDGPDDAGLPGPRVLGRRRHLRAGRTRSPTSSWAAAPCRWPRRRCSTTPSGPTSSAGSSTA